jgi:hypothetical protein
MAYEPPEDLIALQREYEAAYEVYRGALAEQSPATAIAAMEAEISDEQRAKTDAALAEVHRLLSLLYGPHAWWGEVDNAHLAREALRKAARA